MFRARALIVALGCLLVLSGYAEATCPKGQKNCAQEGTNAPKGKGKDKDKDDKEGADGHSGPIFGKGDKDRKEKKDKDDKERKDDKVVVKQPLANTPKNPGPMAPQPPPSESTNNQPKPKDHHKPSNDADHGGRANPLRVQAVTAIYREVLGREPEEAGLNHWTNTPYTIKEMRRHIVQTEEGRGRVTHFYNTLLCRKPDAPGLEYWVNNLAEGRTLDWVREQFLASPERQAAVKAGTCK